MSERPPVDKRCTATKIEKEEITGAVGFGSGMEHEARRRGIGVTALRDRIAPSRLQRLLLLPSTLSHYIPLGLVSHSTIHPPTTIILILERP